MRSPLGRVGARLAALLPGRADLAAMRREPRRDLLAGLTVAVVALPLALGFGVSSGLGAEAGLATAVVAGALAAVFGGSNLQVSGPDRRDDRGAGADRRRVRPGRGAHGRADGRASMLVALAVLRAGRYMRYVPAPVVEGFTLGIACVIGAAAGPDRPGGAQARRAKGAGRRLAGGRRSSSRIRTGPRSASRSAVAAVMLIGARWRPTVPFSLLAVIAATVVAAGRRPGRGDAIGELPSGLPAPRWPSSTSARCATLLAPAVAVAALAALE